MPLGPPDAVNMIKKNLYEINENILRAAVKSGRSRDDILLLGVTKTVPVYLIKLLQDFGVKTFGENRVQELLGKYEMITGASWHLIGTLQTNKVKFIIDKAEMIHSLDSPRLAEEIEKRAAEIDKRQRVLIEVNIAGEETKQGVPPEEAVEFAESLSSLRHLRLEGLMCVAPFVEDAEENREHFRKMRRLLADIQCKLPDNQHLRHLSMGMTSDYVVAVEEGATMVRIGTGIFGERGY